MNVQPLPLSAGAAALARSVGTSAALLASRRVHQPPGNVGRCIRFADGTSSVVYRETVIDRPPPAEPLTLVVGFRLRAIGTTRWMHTAFRAESLLNTPLFVGFPGFTSKLWLAADHTGRYRGVYDWDGASAAESYVRALWWALAAVCQLDSIDYHVFEGAHREETLAAPPTSSGLTDPWCQPR
ncbi:hypothetical protein O4215_24165 [Rhodococcus maanshanensis]|uniref:hypothetical protein n=1 Tax=Rhodococcus maanshanensis TaxID=183556 RepID=UPI0022B411D2|nr:hypothetical protein [Rhodococcus maanshanensis]MCZ4558661.1 hypothetical protein [Rhodococcus maanshanensis]